jgi:hypothetical protein
MNRKRLVSLETKWEKEGKSSSAKAKLRYYYRHRSEILSAYKSVRGGRDVWGMWEIKKQCGAMEY